MSETAILYARVSTPGQVEKGYSLDQQIECLRQYAAEHELEVLEEIRDAGYSGATLDRPGMDRIFAVVAGGGVDVVLAQDADRITREPWHFGYLKAEFERYGTKLRALDDGDDETPEGEFFAGIRRGMSKMEREYTKRRTRRGKEKKIRSGKLLGSGPPPYGFRWIQDDKGKRIGFEVDPETMPVVHRLFELVGAHGLPMYTAAKELERQGFYAPKGGLWRVSVVRNILLNDVYRPHTVKELRASGIAEGIVAALDTAEEYGVSWFGKRRTIGPARGPRTYRKVPRAEWIGVPVPSAGVPREWIESARDALRNNPIPGFLKERSRAHEVNGGIAVCGECGRNLTTHSTTTKSGKKHWYYVCAGARPRGPRTGERRCQNRKMHPAEALEQAVVAYVDGELLTDQAELERHMDDAIAAEQLKLGGNAAWTETLTNRLAECETEKDRLVQLYRRGGLTDPEYDRHAAEIAERRRAAEQGLAEARGSASRLSEMQKARRAMLETFGTGLMSGIYWFPPRLRRGVYRLLGLHVEVFANQTVRVEGEFDANLMRLTPEVERWVEGLREIDARLEERAYADPPKDIQEGIDRIEQELTALRRRICEESATSG
jgi:site-specific DNA recombinase